MARRKLSPPPAAAESYRHPEAESLMRPEIGTQGNFKKKKPPQTHRYDSSLSPALEWDGQNPVREEGEQLIAVILKQSARLKVAKTDSERAAAISAIQDAGQKLKALGRPFLNWAGKAERL